MRAFETSAVLARETVREIARAGLDPQEFFHEVSIRIRRVVPHDASGWMTLDPDTMLPNGALETDKPPELVRALWRNELLEVDVHQVADMAQWPLPEPRAFPSRRPGETRDVRSARHAERQSRRD